MGPRNFFNLHPFITIRPDEVWSITADVNLFWRLETEDGVYTPSGQLLREPKGSRKRFVGSAVSLTSQHELTHYSDRHGDLFALLRRRLHPRHRSLRRYRLPGAHIATPVLSSRLALRRPAHGWSAVRRPCAQRATVRLPTVPGACRHARHESCPTGLCEAFVSIVSDRSLRSIRFNGYAIAREG